MMLLACSALAVALPAAAQSYGRDGYYDRYGPQYDRGNGYGYGNGYLNGYGEGGWGSPGVRRQLVQLNQQVQADYQNRIIGDRVARAFTNRIQELNRAEVRAREKNRGELRPDQSRDLRVAVVQVQRDLEQYEQQSSAGYGYRGGFGYTYGYDRR